MAVSLRKLLRAFSTASMVFEYTVEMSADQLVGEKKMRTAADVEKESDVNERGWCGENLCMRSQHDPSAVTSGLLTAIRDAKAHRLVNRPVLTENNI